MLKFNQKLFGLTNYGGMSSSNGMGVAFSYQLPDITPPVISNINPSVSSTITDKTPTITFDLNENGSCRASTTDESYANMSDNVDCTGDGTQNISCTLPDIGSNGVKNIYFSCVDSSNNADTVDTNTTVSYTLDATAPIISGISPVSGSTITIATPTIMFDLDENGSCRASSTDESYADMSDNVDCTGDSTQSASCLIPDLGTNGSKSIYLACTDTLNNEDTTDTNTLVTYTLAVPSEETDNNSDNSNDVNTVDTTSSDEVINQGNTELELNMTISQDDGNTLEVKWDIPSTVDANCTITIVDKNGSTVYINTDVPCTGNYTIPKEALDKLKNEDEYTIVTTIVDNKTGEILGTDFVKFTYEGQTLATKPNVIVDSSKKTNTSLPWWVYLAGFGLIAMVTFSIFKRKIISN